MQSQGHVVTPYLEQIASCVPICGIASCGIVVCVIMHDTHCTLEALRDRHTLSPCSVTGNGYKYIRRTL